MEHHHEGPEANATEEEYKEKEKKHAIDEKEEIKRQKNEGQDDPTNTNGDSNQTSTLRKDERKERDEKLKMEEEDRETKDPTHKGLTTKIVGKLSAKDTGPAGGHDDTPVPSASSGYTLKFTFHRASNLPVADLPTGSSDPFVIATLTSLGIQNRHKEDPDIKLRTKTIHKSTAPEWNQEWIVGGIPKEGFKLKCRLYDEDAADADDRLGNVTITVPSLPEPKHGEKGCGWEGIKEQTFAVKKRMGSWRAYALKGVTSLCRNGTDMTAHLVVSIEMLGESEEKGRMYTLGPSTWTKHYSPMIGRIAGVKAPKRNGNPASTAGPHVQHDGTDDDASRPISRRQSSKNKVVRYDFQANQLQLHCPVPEQLYHRFVEFSPFVRGMFTASGLRGKILNKALHHQHTQIYSFSTTTQYGTLEPATESVTRKFLELVHAEEEGGHDEDGMKTGGRLFTYVLTLDGLLRFTETGKEFGIDLLSKHTMHADVNVYIACSGEFFVRRLHHSKHDELPRATADGEGPAASSPFLSSSSTAVGSGNNNGYDGQQDGQGNGDHRNKSSSAAQQAGQLQPVSQTTTNSSPHGGPDPKEFELVIDNDSGTYRPLKAVLPYLGEFLEKNFPGLKISVEDCGDDKLQDEKKTQREIKKGGKRIQVLQRSGSGSSGWSSDQERLNGMGEGSEDEDTQIRRTEWKQKSKRERVVAVVEDPEAVVKKLLDKGGTENEKA